MLMTKSFRTLVATAALALLAGGAQAATLTLTNVGCNISQLTTSTACEGAYAGNDSNSNLDGIFSSNGWAELAKVNSSAGTDGFLTVTAASDKKSGTWSWTATGGWAPYTKVMAVLKGGPTFSAYLLNLTSTSGNWNTQGIATGGGKAGPDLSHFSLYWATKDSGTGGGGGGGTTPVPLPAGLPLMLGGFGLMALIARRKARKA